MDVRRLLPALLAIVALGTACTDRCSPPASDRSSVTSPPANQMAPSADLRMLAAESVTCKGNGVVGVCEEEGNEKVLVLEPGVVPELRRRLEAKYRQQLHLRLEEPLPPLPFDFPISAEFVAIGEVPPEPVKEEPKRPASIGMSIGHAKGHPGTLGCRVRKLENPNAVYFLSNWHVLVPLNCKEEDLIYQPSRRDSGEARPIARVANCREDYQEVEPLPATNRMDAAIATTTRECVGSASPGLEIKPDNHFMPAKADMLVQKYGRTTRYTTGPVVCAKARVCVKYMGEYSRFEHQIIVGREKGDGPFCYDGDSGALVVGPDGTSPVGLVFAWQPKIDVRQTTGIVGIRDACLASPIGDVLKRFGVEVDAGAAMGGGDRDSCKVP